MGSPAREASTKNYVVCKCLKMRHEETNVKQKCFCVTLWSSIPCLAMPRRAPPVRDAPSPAPPYLALPCLAAPRSVFISKNEGSIV